RPGARTGEPVGATSSTDLRRSGHDASWDPHRGGEVQRTTAPPRRPDLPPEVAAAVGTHPQTAAMQDRFLDVLRASPAARAVALPDRFRPLVRGLARRPVMIAHDRVSRAALRAVKRPAATLGNVVHLERAPDSSAATVELLAHELVHAASAPSRPRFFAEPGHDHEEHRAMRVGRLARATETARAAGPDPISRVQHAAVLPRMVQRVAADPAPGLAAGVAAPPAGDVVQRQIGGHRASGQAPASPPARPSAPSPGGPPAIPTAAAPLAQTIVATSAPAARAERRTTSEMLNDFEELIDMIEQRVLSELERRGGRVRGWW
ncbi:MAG: hypothetical protein JWM12_3999, partial [Ilumatobacteraceae bacterium]|nr:hypothetical protein [Ilumatobacteraceae bacterium]